MNDEPAPSVPEGVPPDDATPSPPIEIVDFVDPATPPLAPPSRPWVTLGAALAVGAGYLMAQSMVIMVYLFAEIAHGRRPDPNTLGEKLMHDGTVLSIVGLAGAAASVPLTLLFGHMLGHGSWDHTLGLRATSLGAIFRWTLAIVAVATGIDLLNWNAGGDVTVPFMVDAYRTANPRLLLVLMLVVGAPLSEELLFRGLLFGGLVGTRLGVTGTVLFTAVTFAAMHVQYDLPNIGVIAVFGICLGMARARTRSIYPCFAMHAALNAVAYIQTAYIAEQ